MPFCVVSDGKLPPQYADYTTTVTFERNRGFAGASNHWQRNGIATGKLNMLMRLKNFTMNVRMMPFIPFIIVTNPT
jgi:hypothetical protein